jgi:hypothetical protein
MFLCKCACLEYILRPPNIGESNETYNLEQIILKIQKLRLTLTTLLKINCAVHVRKNRERFMEFMF